MKKLLASVVLGLLASLPAAAQQVASLEPSRIVIAPPQTDLAETIKAGLAQSYSMAQAGTRAHTEAQELYFFYGERYFDPLWLDTAPDGRIVYSEPARRIAALFAGAAREGLRPEDYPVPEIDAVLRAGNPGALAAIETAFTASVMRYADHIHNGRIRPADVSGYFDIPRKPIDQAALMARLAAGEDPAAVFAELEPKHPDFLALKAALARFDAEQAPRPTHIADGPLLRLGASDPRVPQLRERLHVAELSGGTVYDQTLHEAVRQFQASLGLEADGIVGPATIAALNGGAATRREDILANMERWRWMPSELGAFNVFVNIPEFRLAINDGGEEAYATRVVVGTVANQTPIFSDNIRHVVVNPYWNVPSSIIRGEVAPAVMRNPGYITANNMELLYNGSVVSPAQVNWAVVSATNFPFRVRQKPGPGNALGQIKFLFPNKHDVYLHDTPSKSLFSRSQRAFSHGCIRVENPMEFAEALMAYEESISRASLEALFGPSERWVNPSRHIPVHIAYFTLRADADGTLRSYGDVYGHNERLVALMQL